MSSLMILKRRGCAAITVRVESVVFGNRLIYDRGLAYRRGDKRVVLSREYVDRRVEFLGEVWGHGDLRVRICPDDFYRGNQRQPLRRKP